MHYTVHFFNVVKLNQPLLILVATWGIKKGLKPTLRMVLASVPAALRGSCKLARLLSLSITT